jgi:hypothetical protein
VAVKKIPYLKKSMSLINVKYTLFKKVNYTILPMFFSTLKSKSDKVVKVKPLFIRNSKFATLFLKKKSLGLIKYKTYKQLNTYKKYKILNFLTSKVQFTRLFMFKYLQDSVFKRSLQQKILFTRSYFVKNFFNYKLFQLCQFKKLSKQY